MCSPVPDFAGENGLGYNFTHYKGNDWHKQGATVGACVASPPSSPTARMHSVSLNSNTGNNR